MKNQSGNNGKGRQITSPDQLHDYLHVTSASVWIVLVAVILLLIVSLIWSANTTIDSYTDATAKVTGKSMVVTIDDPAMQNRIKSGMTILVVLLPLPRQALLTGPMLPGSSISRKRCSACCSTENSRAPEYSSDMI